MTLTPRERLVARLLITGMSNQGIADTLGKCRGTIKCQVASIIRKCGARNRTEAVGKLAYADGRIAEEGEPAA